MTTGSVPPNTVVVTGHGSTTVTPDAAVLRVGLEARADAASVALDEVARRAQEVLAATTYQGIDEGDVQTQGVALHPQMDERGLRVVTYVASYSMSVRLRTLDLAPVVVAAISEAAGVSLRLGGFQLSTADSEAARNDAAARAVKDARSKAERVAEAAGVRLGRVLAISEMQLAAPPRRLAAFAATRAPVPVEAGSDEVLAQVTVTFEIAD